MALRSFDDRNGQGWQVWRVVPGSSVLERSGWMEGEYRNGWLCFESLSSGERRRLAPVPENWESLPSERLELMCRVASPARRSTPAGGIRSVNVVERENDLRR
jgi:hypothetical protein